MIGSDTLSTNTRCGYVALLGIPNAGKSTLLNRLVGQKIAIVTPKAQTTRSRITGVAIHEQSQLIFVDIPGVFNPPESRKFERAMVACAWQGATDADRVLLIVDAERGLDEENLGLIERLPTLGKPVDLLLNKVDLVDKVKLLELTARSNSLFGFERTFMVSARKGDGVQDVLHALAAMLPEGPWLFPEDHLTDLPERLIASEITREKLFMLMRDELPYSLTVETESWQEKKDGSIRIEQVIYVEREGQKGIVLGKSGQMLKRIGEEARAEIGRLWERPVHLFLFVKVRENWKTNPDAFRYMGLDYNKQ